MVSNLETAKRVLVTLLKSLAGIYSVVLGLTRESTNTQVKAAYKKVSLKAHPDQGGEAKRQAALNATRDTWVFPYFTNSFVAVLVQSDIEHRWHFEFKWSVTLRLPSECW